MVENDKLVEEKSAQNGQDRRLLREVAYDKLKDAIQSGELPPGEPLYEIHLSEKLKISRTPVREALQQLVLEGLVKNLPNRAMTVATLSLEELLNVLHIRSLLDPEITRLVAGAITSDKVKALREAVAEMSAAAEAEDRKAWAKADSKFHALINGSCPNALLGQMGMQMRNRTQLVATDAQTTHDRLCDCTKEHEAVVEAIAARNGQAAFQAMQDHLTKLRESFFKRLMHQ